MPFQLDERRRQSPTEGHLKPGLRVGSVLPAGYADLQAQSHTKHPDKFHHDRGR